MKVKHAKILMYSVIGIYLFIMMFPFIWVFLTSFKPTSEIFGSGAFNAFTSNPTLEHYRTIIFEKGMLKAVMNSFIVATATTLYVIIVATFAAYAISRFNFRFKNLLLGIILSVSMFPQMILVGPIYNLFSDLGWINSYAVILPYSTITLPIAVWILVAHFKQIPLSLEEAGKIDGASRFQILMKIIMPIAAPGVFTTAIIVFISAWNEFLLTITLNPETHHTVPVAISLLKTQFSILWGQVNSAAVVVTIPTLIIVLIFQKQIISGLTSGAVKE